MEKWNLVFEWCFVAIWTSSTHKSDSTAGSRTNLVHESLPRVSGSIRWLTCCNRPFYKKDDVQKHGFWNGNGKTGLVGHIFC